MKLSPTNKMRELLRLGHVCNECGSQSRFLKWIDAVSDDGEIPICVDCWPDDDGDEDEDDEV